MNTGDDCAAVASSSYVCNSTRANLPTIASHRMMVPAKHWEVFAMNIVGSRLSARTGVFRKNLAVTILLSSVVSITGALADDNDIQFRPGNLLVSRSVYDNNNPAKVVAGTTQLPPNCLPANCVTATDGGQYPFVFNNNLVDSSMRRSTRSLIPAHRHRSAASTSPSSG
jgi:hypothetical protein